jgi:hypothetical protein
MESPGAMPIGSDDDQCYHHGQRPVGYSTDSDGAIDVDDDDTNDDLEAMYRDYAKNTLH